MPPRAAGIPGHRGWASLQSIKDRNWVIQADLYPAGKGMIARKGRSQAIVELRMDTRIMLSLSRFIGLRFSPVVAGGRGATKTRSGLSRR
jgi:hypothetical protein